MAKRTIAAQHIEWLELVEIDGPFLSLPVLCDRLDDGVAHLEGRHVRRELRDRYERWQEGDLSYEDWIDHVLVELLGYDEYYLDVYSDAEPAPASLTHEVAEHGETLAPTMLLRIHDEGPGADEPQMLVMTMPEDRDGRSLSRRVPGSRWAASPISRMAELLRATGIRLGLVTDGEQWTLVDVPPTGDDRVVGTGSWFAADWDAYEIALRSFVDILGQRRFFAVAEDKTPQSLLAESRESQYEVTDQLGLQVRRAVEILVRALDRADKDANGALLEGISDRRVYQAATSVMMRLVVLMCAEERELLPLGDPLFDAHYAVSTLGEQLRAKADELGDEVLERSCDAWPRLLAAFRAIHAGIEHDRLRLAGYGGAIFDPDRFPFLEGRGRDTTWETVRAQPIEIHNRTVLHVLDALQYLKTRIGGHTERRRLTFKALGVEQIGHVYEGLLDHAAERCDEPVLGLIGTKPGEEAEVKISTLEEMADKSPAAYHKALSGLGVGSTGKIKKVLEAGVDAHRAATLRAACGDEPGLWKRIEPYAALVRNDDLGDPLVIAAKSIFVTSGIDRRATGTHYTPRALTEPIVERTLEPQVYEGPAEGRDRDAWRLKSPAEILDLKVCDPACGSGAFLVATVRYLADRLVASWSRAEEATGGAVDTMGEPVVEATEAHRVPKADEDRVHLARRLVAGRCVYGVDKNPAAVEMAKLSLWLLVLAKDEPFGFLDHAIKCGDSLVGLTGKQIGRMTWEEPESGEGTLFAEIGDAAAEAAARREAIEAMGVGHEEEKQALHAEAEQALADAKLVGDVIIAAFFKGTNDRERCTLREEARTLVERWKAGKVERSALEAAVGELLHGEHPLSPFHWELEFPEAFCRARSGFDGIVGNPPFLGGRLIAIACGDAYTPFLKKVLRQEVGSADLSVYFTSQMVRVLAPNGSIGQVAPRSLHEGDTRELFEFALVQYDAEIIRAVSAREWPGHAAVEITHVHLWKGSWGGGRWIDDRSVNRINTKLMVGEDLPEPRALKGTPAASMGINLLGAGFLISDKDQESFLLDDSRSSDVIKQYIGGEYLLENREMREPRYCLDLNHLDLDAAKTYGAVFRHLAATVKPQRDRLTRQVHESCFWKHWDKRQAFFDSLDLTRGCLAIPRVAKHFVAFHIRDYSNVVLADSCVVIDRKSASLHAVLQSRLHDYWISSHCTYRGKTRIYTVGRCLRTFPFPVEEPGTEGDLQRAVNGFFEALDALSLRDAISRTAAMNRVHSPSGRDSLVNDIRASIDLLDQLCLGLYGWDDLASEPGHRPVVESDENRAMDCHYGWESEARRELIRRLSELNQKRYEEEVAQGLHDTGKGAKKKKTKKKTTKAVATKTKAKSDAADPEGDLFVTEENA